MGRHNRYRDHVDPEYRRWGRTYPAFPGVEECARLVLDRKVTGAWADIVVYELAENADSHLAEMTEAFRAHKSDAFALCILMALELAALPASVEILAAILKDGNSFYVPYAKRALHAVGTRESRRVLFDATHAPIVGAPELRPEAS